MSLQESDQRIISDFQKKNKRHKFIVFSLANIWQKNKGKKEIIDSFIDRKDSIIYEEFIFNRH